VSKLKRCNNCFKEKPVTEFYPKPSAGPNAYQVRCKACNAQVCYAWVNRKKPRKLERYFEALEATGAREGQKGEM
jgi:hypothetical protein